MNELLRSHADLIVSAAISAVLPEEAVRKALGEFKPGTGKTVLIAVGKAAWRMANAAVQQLPGAFTRGMVITKYGHVMGEIDGVECHEAGHPFPDANGMAATRRAISLVSSLTTADTVLFLLSGGASALFEDTVLPLDELRGITRQLLERGADIGEINTVRKRLSRVKGGRFAEICAPARVYSVILSDVLGDSPDVIASGPAYPDASDCADASEIARRYNLNLSGAAVRLLNIETPKKLYNVETIVTGSVRELCRAACAKCGELGYEPVFLTDRLCCEAKDVGVFLSNILRSHGGSSRSLAYIAGGEPIVHVTGSGKGGRAQELALAAADGIAGMYNACVFSFGSDGTDGPTDAAGGYVDGYTRDELSQKGFGIRAALGDNDAYTALGAVGGLTFTGPTGTNVNDAAVGLLL